VVEGSTDDPSETELEIIKPESEMEGEELPTITQIPPLTPVISQVKILDGPESVPKFPEPYSSVDAKLEEKELKLKEAEKKTTCKKLTKAEEDKVINKTIKDLKSRLKKRENELQKWDKNAKDTVEEWYGNSSEKTRKVLMIRIEKMQTLLSSYTVDNFKPAVVDPSEVYAYVYSDDDSTIYLGEGFCDASETGRDSKMGVLAHEMSHFNSIGGTNEEKTPYEKEIYYEKPASDLAKHAPDYAIHNAENFGYYIEG
jgi:hypothetical protein